MKTEYLVVKKGEQYTFIELEKHGAHKFVTYCVNATMAKELSKEQVFNLMGSADNYYLESLPSDDFNDFLDLFAEEENLEEILIEISKPLCLFALVSNENGTILKTGSYDVVTNAAKGQIDIDVLSLELIIAWSES